MRAYRERKAEEEGGLANRYFSLSYLVSSGRTTLVPPSK